MVCIADMSPFLAIICSILLIFCLRLRNPVVDQQALYRCYRYGQTKPVYAYRFLTEGTMEEKVYSRSVNKTNLAARVIDQKDPQRNFTQQELVDIMAIDNWVSSRVQFDFARNVTLSLTVYHDTGSVRYVRAMANASSLS